MATAIKSMHTTKRLYSIAASPPLKPSSAVRTIPTSPRPRRASLSLSSTVSASSSTAGTPSVSVNSSASTSGSRTLYTNAQGPLHYFDSGAPPPPPPPPLTSRPGNPHIVSTSRLTAGEAQSQSQPSNGNTSGNTVQNPQSLSQTQSQTQSQQSQPTQHSTQGQNHHGQAHSGQQAEGGSQPLLGSTSLTFSLAAPTPPPGSSPPDRGLLLNAAHGGIAGGHTRRSRETTAEASENRTRDSDERRSQAHSNSRIFQLDVGAYGIPKRGRERGRGVERGSGGVDACEDYAYEALDGAVQVGEDAYFVREDALGVADGVGGWGSRMCSNSNHQYSPSTSHSCSSCAAASTSTSSATSRVNGPSRHLHRSSHRSHGPALSPSALFARRLMHYCAREVGESRSAVVSAAASHLEAKERAHASSQGAELGATSRPSLKDGNVAPRIPSPSVPRTGSAKPAIGDPVQWRNARPFAWPWEEPGIAKPEPVSTYSEFVEGLEALAEATGEERMRAALGTPTAANDVTGGKDSTAVDPLAGTIDPVDVLERAYNRALDAHRVRRRVRVVKAKVPKGAHWWPYGFGLKPSSSSLQSIAESDQDNKGLVEEWEDRWEPLVAGSSTALLAVLSGDRLRIAHLGDCVGWLVRGGEVVWRSEEMWWGFNYPLQLGPASPTVPSDARRYELSVKADDILILASDGMSDNLWEEDVLDEVRRAVAAHIPLGTDRTESDGKAGGMLGRRTLAGMLSEALCSRARSVSEQSRGAASPAASAKEGAASVESEDDLPFARRAREEGRSFRGGKCDDISVLVAVISPVVPSSVPVPPAPPSVQESVATSNPVAIPIPARA